ncbi:MAG TPA: LysR family transcriptional regulator [Xanthobacteraceae bacterium]|nr:LysR family transcriptional regulator [Xanthobacteraceae bacterium]
MNLRQLETFYWAAKLGSFSAAADRLNATQSTVSMRIQDLERDFGRTLFDRGRRGARITAMGRELMRYAEEVLRLSAEVRERLAGSETMPGVLRIGVVEMISVTWLPRLVKAIHETYPKLALELDEALTQNLVEDLNQGNLDLILAAGRTPGYNFNQVSLGGVEFAWMASPSLSLPKRRLGPRDLQHWPVIALSRESYHHRSIEEWFRSGGAHCRRIDTCKSLGVAAALAGAGLGVTLLPPRCYRNEIKAGRLQVITVAPRFRPVEFTATCSVATIQPLARRIAELASEVSDFDKGRRSANKKRSAM